jgi:cell division protein FtsB
MKTFKRKKKLKNILEYKTFLFLLVFGALILGNSAYNMYKRANDTQTYLNAKNEEYSGLEEQYNRAINELDYYNTETGIERELRAKFDLARDGERALFIINEEEEYVPKETEKSIWQKFVNWVSF